MRTKRNGSRTPTCRIAHYRDSFVFEPGSSKSNFRTIRDRAILALLIGCALRRSEVAALALAPHDLRRTCANFCRSLGGELEQIQLLLGHASIQTIERYLGTRQDLVHAPNDAINLKLLS
jgi:integrase